MPGSNTTYFTIFVLAATFGILGWQLTARSAYESAAYTVVEEEGRFEIREYPELKLATTSMEFQSQGDDGSFMRLFRYISGSNEDQQKVEMTTPVFMEPESADREGQMGFVIPLDVAAEGVPNPTDAAVEIETRTAGRFAVIRFAGRMNPESVEQAEAELREWMTEQGLTADGEAEIAGYDPPWTPGPLRRNEVLIRIQQSEAE